MDRRPIRVLLVEDDEDDYLLTRDLLAEIGPGEFDVEWVRAYEAALEAVARGGHDVCLLDYRLDGRTGLDLLHEASAAIEIPVILLTGQGDRALDLEAMQAGAADFLVKGRIDAPLLERSIRYALERHRAAEALRRAHEELEARVAARTSELSDANAQLVEADRRKDEFLAMLAHELRNPLAPLCNALHLLEQTGLDPEALERTRGVMERQVGHLIRLVDDLLDVSRIMRGRVQVRRELVDLPALIRTGANDRRAMLAEAGLHLVLELPEVPVCVAGDDTRLTQVLGNLLDNARKFKGAGGQVTVRLAVDAEKGQAVLVVRDDGAGIEPALLPRLFNAFAQGDRSLDRSRGGLGLGLAVVKGLVELHGGTVEAASEGPGRGAEFTVRLPLKAEQPALIRTPARVSTRAGEALRVLIVEDNRDAADSLRMVLELYGHQVAVAYTGPDGVKSAKAWRPDVVLCDIGLPGLDGYGVANQLRSDATTAKARLIALTGYGRDEDCRRSLQAGFDDHRTKPVDPAALQPLLLRPEESGRPVA
jgi:signal transduction histidine kinase